jgi:peptidoglycan/xylan/chitin deacetylase (PgdA/CDA1 family)
MTKSVLIRIDVDSVEGIRHGVEFYFKLFEKYGFHASFFVPMGRNNVVSAGFRRMWRPAFWRQLYYMKPWSTYRLFDSDYDKDGEIGASHPDTLRAMERKGHEVALHGFDHAFISDNAYTMSEVDYGRQIELARNAYEAILDHPPAGTGTPAWRCTEMIARVQDRSGFRYASDMIGAEPCRLRFGDYVSRTIQVPANIDNVFPLVVGYRGDHRKTLDHLKAQIDSRGDYVAMTVHTEYEFVHFGKEMDELFAYLADQGYVGKRYDRFAQGLNADDLPVKDLVYYSYNGAVGPVAATDRLGLLH